MADYLASRLRQINKSDDGYRDKAGKALSSLITSYEERILKVKVQNYGKSPASLEDCRRPHLTLSQSINILGADWPIFSQANLNILKNIGSTIVIYVIVMFSLHLCAFGFSNPLIQQYCIDIGIIILSAIIAASLTSAANEDKRKTLIRLTMGEKTCELAKGLHTIACVLRFFEGHHRVNTGGDGPDEDFLRECLGLAKLKEYCRDTLLFKAQWVLVKQEQPDHGENMEIPPVRKRLREQLEVFYAVGLIESLDTRSIFDEASHLLGKDQQRRDRILEQIRNDEVLHAKMFAE